MTYTLNEPGHDEIRTSQIDSTYWNLPLFVPPEPTGDLADADVQVYVPYEVLSLMYHNDKGITPILARFDGPTFQAGLVFRLVKYNPEYIRVLPPEPDSKYSEIEVTGLTYVAPEPREYWNL